MNSKFSLELVHITFNKMIPADFFVRAEEARRDLASIIRNICPFLIEGALNQFCFNEPDTSGALAKRLGRHVWRGKIWQARQQKGVREPYIIYREN